jgi:hypothetical protein
MTLSWHDRQTEEQRLEQLATGRRRFEERAHQIAESYEGRRTIQASMVREMLDLLEDRVTEVEQQHADRLAGLQAAHLAQVTLLEERVETYKARSQQLGAALEEKRTLREARERAGEEVQVTIDRSLGGWTVADLEEVAYRLRCGGAVDDTPVKVTDWAASALVPAPDLVRLDRPALPERPVPPERWDPLHDPVVPEGGTLSVRSVVLGGGVLAALLLVLDVVRRVIA